MDPIWAHFVGILGQFGFKKNAFFSKKNCSKSIFVGSQVVWDPQKPKKIGPLDPSMDPIWAHFVGILGQFGVKKNAFFSGGAYITAVLPRCYRGVTAVQAPPVT